jgi:D-alanine-D-alanine ligase-like ATP-grasp enzyme
VLLSEVSNMHQGGEFIDVTDAMHQSYVDVIERAVKLMPDLVLCGADIVIGDANAPAAKHDYYVLELNCGPGFSTNHYPLAWTASRRGWKSYRLLDRRDPRNCVL